MKIKNIYKTFDTKIIRTPLYPLEDYKMIPKEGKDIIPFVEKLFENPTFKEAIFLASPELFYEWKKSIQKEEYSLHKKQQLFKSILKYYIRSITNCIPFGLFASYGITDSLETTDPIIELSLIHI